MLLSEDGVGALPKDTRVQSCLFNYVVSAQKPTSVTHSACGNFTSSTALNLIIGKCTRIEIHTVTDEGLQGVLDVPVYGRISCLELVRISNEAKDLLFVSTERYKFFVIEYDESSGELITRANGDARGLSGRPTDSGQIGVLDPDCRLIGLYLYEGLFKVIPIQARVFKEAYDVRLEELEVIDLKFMHRCLWPTLAVLYQDPKGGRHLKTYEIHDKDFVPGTLKQHNLEPGARIIIPVPNEIGGVVVVGEVSIMYIGFNVFKAVPMHRSLIRVSCCIDCKGLRYLLSDSIGVLYLLILQQDMDGLLTMSMEPLGHVSPASSLTYLDNGIVFVGSGACDSQLIRLNRTPITSDPSTCVDVIQNFTNLGPIVDFCVVDLDRQGQGQVVTCSGVYSNGSLRVIRNGIGINEHGCVEMKGIKAMWSLKSALGCQDEFLIVTFVGETRVFRMADNGILQESKCIGIVTSSQSLYCGNVIDDKIMQITAEGIFLLHAPFGDLIHHWKPSTGQKIDVAAAVSSQIVIGTRDNCLLYLEVVSNKIIVKAEKKLDADISCLDLNFFGESMSNSKVAVGTWALDLTIYSIPHLTVLSEVVVEGDLPPKSLKFAMFEECCFLLCALGDGYLLVYPITEGARLSRNPRKLSLGTKPVSLHAFKSNGTDYIFAASDRPSVIYYSNKKLLYSNLNQNEVNFMTSFTFKNSLDTLAIATDGSLLIGNIDDVQKLHIRTVSLGEQPRRIAHQDSTRTFGVLTIHTDMMFKDIRDFHESSFLRLIDDQMFEVSDSFKLENFETGCSIMDVKLFSGKLSCYVVGTAFVLPDESEPSKGRILVFKVVNNKLILCMEREVKGAVYNLNDFNGYILAGINSRVQLFECLQKDDCKMDLRPHCSHVGHILALHVETRGDFIVVGDLMKSISLLLYKSSENVIEERARDFNSSWITSVKILDDDTYLGAENGYNIFVVHKNSEAATDEERMRLEVIGEMHVGDLINRFRVGSLVMKQPDGEHIPTVLFGTINGVIGLVASLPETVFNKLCKIQDALRKIVKGVGGLSHSEWRSFENERRIGTGRPEEQRLFVDGDLIEQFLELRREKMMEVAVEVGDMSIDDICKLVEDVARLH